MIPLNRRDRTLTYVDDQSPTLQNSYVGDWSRYKSDNYTMFYAGTYTATTSPGASFSFTFSGNAAWLYGDLLDANLTQDGHFITYPTADYLVDGNPDNSTVSFPFITPDKTIVYFQTLNLKEGPHTVNLTVTSANGTNPFIIDWYYFQSNAETDPSSSSTATSPLAARHHVGAIVGTVVACLVVIALLIIAIFWILRKSRGDHGRDVEKPDLNHEIPDGYHVEPFDPSPMAHTSSPAEISQPANPSGGSNLPLGPSPGAITY